MNDYLNTYAERAARFTDVVRHVPDHAWSHRSPCPDWTAADVVRHVVDSQRDFLARHDLAPSPVPDAATAPAQLWAAHVELVLAALGDGDALDREFAGYFGPTTIGATLADFYGFDMIVHRWDLARASGRTTEFTDTELDRLETSLEEFGEHAYAPGVFGPPVDVPPDASRQDRLLALMGRDPAAHL
ncbi:MAG TPA: TIGR03086 family metal-binding protein [Marmoricola sp.]|jgi:uncharacterized protein (TIGR03086 family)|nr:TIGR03086 family metal-binding protein [Marmoricola sp.]